jgi:putative addiction module CopG family antidote
MFDPDPRAKLPEELQAFAEECVRSGEYADIEEVIQEAFRLLQQRDKRRRDAREELTAIFSEMAARGDFDSDGEEPNEHTPE